MRRKHILIIAIAVAVLIGGGIILNYRAKDSVPLRYAQIPEETKEFLRDLERFGGDVKIRFLDEPIKDHWNDETNEGEDAGNGFYKIENENLIVYYHNEGDGNAKANVIFVSAKNSIQPLAELFGKYFYPKDANGRKLALYVCRDRAECDRLSSNNNRNAIAVTSMLMSPSGALCRGIFFHPETFSLPQWSKGDEESSLFVQKIVRHEMAHYVYFSSLDLSRPIKHPMWVTEGIAEYFAEAEFRLREINKSRIVPLSEFETAKYQGVWFSDAYWIGYTAFLYFDKSYGRENINNFLQLSYKNSTRFSLEKSVNVSLEQFDREWQESVKNL